jgi:hypothetical protein
MKILLLQLDGKLPNIALMRIAAHHRALGDEVELRKTGNRVSIERQLWDEHDRVYASLIFERTKPLAERLLCIYPRAVVGGTGWDIGTTLEQHGIATLEQDYTIYPGTSQSIGFLQRGCRLRCPFCVVPRKEGGMREERSVAELWRGGNHARELVLLDNDFFGNPAWQERITEIREGSFKVSFNQGINARFLTKETAEAIASVDYREWNMRQRRIYTAWDNRKDEHRLLRGLQFLVDAGVNPNHIMVYMLIGYWAGETHGDRDHRRATLRAFGARPYPMPFLRSRELVSFQRWVIGGYDKSITWKTWCEARGEPRNLNVRKSPQLRLPLLAQDSGDGSVA